MTPIKPQTVRGPGPKRDLCRSMPGPLRIGPGCHGNIVTNRYDPNGNLILCSLLGEITDVPGTAEINFWRKRSSLTTHSIDWCNRALTT